MQGRQITLLKSIDALEIRHPKANSESETVLIVDSEDNVGINKLHDKNIEFNTLMNVCYTVCKTIKKPMRFIYMPVSKQTFDTAWVKLKDKDWKGISIHDSLLSFGMNSPLSDTIGCFFKKDGNRFVVSVPLKGILGSFTKGTGGPNLLGFFLKDLTQIASRPFHSLAPIKEPQVRMVNTIDRFNKMMKDISSRNVLSIDTETSGLNRITSSLLMVQIAISNEIAYCLPMDGHNESPWTADELKYIKKKFGHYLSYTESTHLMHFASFDIGQLMHHFKVKYYNADIYDTIAAEFGREENLKFLRTKTYSPYGLEFVELRYGLIRPQGLIAKDQRKNMANFPIDQIAQYGSYDVISLFDIRDRQLEACTHPLIGYKTQEQYEKVVIKQIGAMSRVFSTMQNNGMVIDVDYLMELVSPTGPLETQKKEVINKLFTLPSVQKLNRRLLKRQGHSANTLFDDEVRIFNINKPAHKSELFFDILNLDPVSFGKALDSEGNPKPSTDKAFQAHYAATVPEVASLTDYNKVTKLKSAFADAIMERIIQDSDFILDGRLRSSYGFSSVLSGRCIHKDSMIAVLDNRQNVPIKDIKVGDWVWSYNFDTLRPEPKQVLNVYDNGKRPTIKVNTNINTYIICTPDHKIGVLNKSYKKAEDLTYGDEFISLDTKYSFHFLENNETSHVYDIEVEGNHNFFANGILVHNCNAYNINPQQIPSRGPLAKAIKKLFIVKNGRIMIASDFSAHEVRIGGIISRDPIVAKVFLAANEAIREFRLKNITPEEYAEAKEILERKGDIHLLNIEFFYGIQVDKKHPLRDQIKSVVFGVLYGKMAKNLAKAMGIEEEEAQALLDKLFENWSGVKNWIDMVHETANNTFMVHYPNHRVRHMWGYLSADKWVHFAMNRRAVNSPIQGFASDIGVVAIDELNRWTDQNIWKRGYDFDFQTINMVHDAQYNEVAFEQLPLGIYLTEHAMSSLPMEFYKREFGYKLSIPLSYDLDFGKSWADLKEWDKRPDSLFKLVGELGQAIGKDPEPVIQDAKRIMNVRMKELKADPYKRLITPQNCTEFWDKLNMFKKAA